MVKTKTENTQNKQQHVKPKKNEETKNSPKKN